MIAAAEAGATQAPRRGYRPGVGIVLANGAGRVFVARRVDMPGDSWQMPQGGVDAGETPRQAAFRELEEEIGTGRAEMLAEAPYWLSYALPPDVAGRVWGGEYAGQTQKWFLLRFTGIDADIDLATAHPEFDAWKWVELDDLPGLIVPFKRRLYEDVVAEFRAAVGAIAGGSSAGNKGSE